MFEVAILTILGGLVITNFFILRHLTVLKKEEEKRGSWETILWIVGAPDGPGTTVEKVVRLFPTDIISEYPPLRSADPILNFQGKTPPQDFVQKLHEEGFKVVVPTTFDPDCETWVDPHIFSRPLQPPPVWRSRQTNPRWGRRT